MTPSPVPLTRDRVIRLLEKMRGVRVVVLGDAMLDRYLLGDTDRLSPEAPVPVVTVSETRAALGGAANVAANVAAIGARCHLVATAGDDRTVLGDQNGVGPTPFRNRACHLFDLIVGVGPAISSERNESRNGLALDLVGRPLGHLTPTLNIAAFRANYAPPVRFNQPQKKTHPRPATPSGNSA